LRLPVRHFSIFPIGAPGGKGKAQENPAENGEGEDPNKKANICECPIDKVESGGKPQGNLSAA